MMHQQIRTNYRWIVAILLFFATTINYVDRQVIGILKDWIGRDLNWSEKDYSHIVMAFTSIGGTIFPFFIGWILDQFKLSGRINSGYNILFIICSCNYRIAWLGRKFLAPEMKPVRI